MFYIRIYFFHSVLVWPWPIMVMWHFHSAFGSRMAHLWYTVLFGTVNLFNVGDTVRTHIIQNFMENILQSQVKGRSDF